MIYFYCSPLGQPISWLNYSFKQHYVVHRGKMWYTASAEVCIFTVWTNMSGHEIESSLRELDRQPPPAASLHTPHHINTCVHTWTRPHTFQRRNSNFAEFQWTRNIPASSAETSVSWLWWQTAAFITTPPPSPLPLALMYLQVINAWSLGVERRTEGNTGCLAQIRRKYELEGD